MHIALNAQLLSSQPGYRAAGIHTYIHQMLSLIPAYAPAKWEFTAFVGSANHATYPRLVMRHAPFNTESPLKRIVWEQALQPFALREFDLHHAMAFVAPLANPRPFVVTVYDLTFIRYPRRLTAARRLYLRLLTGVTCQRARRVLAISHSTGRDLTDLYGISSDKIDVTPLGYDTTRFRPLPAEQIEKFKRDKGLADQFWLFLGTLEPRKNLVMLLEAYASLAPHERLPLVLAGGKGWDYAPIFAAIETYGLEGEVHLPGFIPDEDMPLWYNSASVFVYPSVFEGFGLPVLEAMACGTPVITSDVSSLPEVAQESGLCLPPHDPTVWTQALRHNAHDTEWREHARRAGLQSAARYRWETTAQQTIDSYRRALSGHNA